MKINNRLLRTGMMAPKSKVSLVQSKKKKNEKQQKIQFKKTNKTKARIAEMCRCVTYDNQMKLKKVDNMNMNAQYSFKEFKNDMALSDLGMSSGEMKGIEAMFSAAQHLEGKGEFELSDALWDEIDSEMMSFEKKESFEEFSKSFELDSLKIPKADMDKIKASYEDMQKLDLKGEFEKSDKKYDELMNLVEKHMPKETFDSFKKDLELDGLKFTKKEMDDLKVSFEKAGKLETEGKLDEADKVWDKIYKAIDKKMPSETFEDFSNMIGLDELKFSKEDHTQIKKNFNQMIKLENSNKMTEADKLWQTIMKKINVAFEKV